MFKIGDRVAFVGINNNGTNYSVKLDAYRLYGVVEELFDHGIIYVKWDDPWENEYYEDEYDSADNHYHQTYGIQYCFEHELLHENEVEMLLDSLENDFEDFKKTLNSTMESIAQQLIDLQKIADIREFKLNSLCGKSSPFILAMEGSGWRTSAMFGC